MARPIRALENGVDRIGKGDFDFRINVTTQDELGRLASRFNEMAAELGVSKEKPERISRLKRFLAPQVAELIENSGNERALQGRRQDVVTIFADLRGFTAFSGRADPETTMHVLGQYYQALGAVITRHGATLTSFAGDGVMLLVNAPVPCADPAFAAIRVASEMQAAVQNLIREWRLGGHALGFGVGIAMGPATVGQIGYDARLDYTAISSVVNLAARLCAAATDGQVLIDAVAAEAVDGRVTVQALGTQPIRGFEGNVSIFSIASVELSSASNRDFRQQ